MRTRNCIFLCSILICVMGKAQHIPVTSLFDQCQIYFNPGATGSEEVLSAIFDYRKQWLHFPGSPNTQLFGIHAPLKNPKVALGIDVEHDAVGAATFTGIYLNYAYRIDIGANKLSFGLKGGFAGASSDYIELREEPDAAFDENGRTCYIPNVGFGISFYSRKYWAGISIPRFFGYESDASDNIRIKHNFWKYEYFFSGGYRFSINPELRIDPSLLLKYNPRSIPSLAINSRLVYKDTYEVGVGTRTGDAIILLIGYSFNRQFSFGYSYDYEIGKLEDYNSGSHEFNILYKFGYKVNASNPRQF
jgi:type IX secretion system PorP/SprF family membrane protein